MEKTHHLFNDHLYHISNKATACCTLFTDLNYGIRFLKQVDKYLSPLCEILHYSLHESEFQLIVKLKSRKQFCAYYRKKHDLPNLEDMEIIHSRFIFSQAMANLLSSTSIHFNRREGRSGALFARRFSRLLIESKSSLNSWITKMNKMKLKKTYNKKWKHRGGMEDQIGWKRTACENNLRCGYGFIRKGSGLHRILSSMVRLEEIDLRGQFDNLPPKNLYSIKNRLCFIFFVKKRPPSPNL